MSNPPITRSLPVLAGVATLLLAGCSSVSLDPNHVEEGRAPSGAVVREVRSYDDRFDGEISGTPAPGSKFAQIKIGMELAQVQKLIGTYDELYSQDTGKRWIPFYLGSEARRIIVHYKGEGCLTYSGGTTWGGGKNVVLRIDVDAAGKCYRP